MNEPLQDLLQRLFPMAQLVLDDKPMTLCVSLPDLGATMHHLRRDPELEFDLLSDHSAADHPDDESLEALWLIHSTAHNFSLRVSTMLKRNKPVLPTMAPLWSVAHWQEREVYDFFGVLYDEHTDLRRLFLEDDWQGFPMRKDYTDDFMLEPGK